MGSCRCKMCGGHIHYADDVSVATCEFCGTEQTIVRTDDLKQLNLFNRANSLRLQNEFDKAQTTYENILIDDPNNAEAHWGICLCRYGIEYVDDKKTNKKVPTCHRTVFNFIYDDLDYIEALNNCDVVAKKQYEKEAKVIDKIQKNILAISQKEAPYDIFICYKETDDNGNRTKDSVIAQEIYDELIKKGYKVFFSRITLESKIGSEYEPIIFAALMSSKVMLAIGSKPEHYNSPWVKNEWARFLGFMKNQQGKYLIPCYFDMEAYDMPEEFLMLQALDLGKLGYMQDLTRGIDKLFGGKKNNVNYSSLSTPEKAIQNLVERIEISLEDADYSSASSFVEEILDIDAKRPEAYLYAILIERKVKSIEALKYIDNPLDDDKNYNKALRFADGEYKEFLIELNNTIKANIEERKNMNAYNNALEYLKKGNYILALNSLVKITEYKDSKELKEKCQKECYSLGIKRKNDGSYGEAVEFFTAANDYQDSLKQKEQCQKLKEEQQAKSLIRMHIRVLNEIIDKVEKTELFAITDKNMYNESLIKLKTMDPEYMPKDKVNYYISKKEELIEIDDARRKRLEEKNIKKKKRDKGLAVIVALVGLAILILIIVLFSKYFSGSNQVTKSTDKTNVNPKTTENLKNHVPIRINVESLTDNYTNFFVDFEIDGAKFDSETRKYDYVEKGTSTWIRINIPSDVKFLGLYNGDTLLTEYDSYHITANEEMNLSLKYCRATSHVKITKNILNAGTVTEDRECEYGSWAEINASQNLGYFFAGWYIGDELISTRERYFVQVLENDLKITAKYQKEPYMTDLEFTSDETTCKITGITNTHIDTLVIPSYVTSIELDNVSFYDCYIGKCFYKGTLEQWCNVYLKTFQCNPMLAGPTFYYLGSRNDITFDGVNYTSCSSVIEIPNTITTIPTNHFYSCKAEKLIIPEGVTTIEGQAFGNCRNLKDIYLPKSITDVYANAFNGSIFIENIFYNGTKDDYVLIAVGANNVPFNDATKYYYSETAPTDDDYYWHYVDGEVTIWE